MQLHLQRLLPPIPSTCDCVGSIMTSNPQYLRPCGIHHEQIYLYIYISISLKSGQPRFLFFLLFLLLLLLYIFIYIYIYIYIYKVEEPWGLEARDLGTTSSCRIQSKFNGLSIIFNNKNNKNNKNNTFRNWPDFRV